jgi:Predicted membrane protein (DUF2207) N-terminal domain
VLFAAWLLLAQPIEIDRFDVAIQLEPDGAFVVTETIAVDFHELRRHGIYRTLPMVYGREENVAGGSLSTRHVTRLQILDIEDGEGNRLAHQSWPDMGTLSIRIGDPDRTVTENVTYAIRYRVQRAINRFEEHDELYWNVTGTEWNWSIHEASVRVRLPGDVPPEQLRHRTFTGLLGSTSTKATERVEANVYHAEVKDLGPGEGLTIVLGLPKGVLLPPSALRELFWKTADNIAYVLVAFMPILALGIMSYFYFKLGRDPGRRDPIVVRYEPPEDLTPAEVGTLLDEHVGIPDVVSIVIDLAVRGI